MATVIGKAKCSACDRDAEVREAKGGALTIFCPHQDCGAHTMVKRPNAVAALRARLAGRSGEPAPAAAGARSAGQDMEDFLAGRK